MIKSLFDEETTEPNKKERKKSPFGGSLLFPVEDDDQKPGQDKTIDSKPAESPPESAVEANDSVPAGEILRADNRDAGSVVESEAAAEMDTAGTSGTSHSESGVANRVTDTSVSNGYEDKEADGNQKADQKPVDIIPFTPEDSGESVRKSGLAYSAAIALFGSVFFMLILGWLTDLFLGIQPWGTVIGIAIGALIGFTQLFRITSQIFNPQLNDFEKVSLRIPVEDGTPVDSEKDKTLESNEPAIEEEVKNESIEEQSPPRMAKENFTENDDVSAPKDSIFDSAAADPAEDSEPFV